MSGCIGVRTSLRRRVAAVDDDRRPGRPARRVAREVRVRADQVGGDPSPSGCLAAIVSIASGGRSAWIPERNVPGHTQLTRIPSRAYSTAATFASWITAAFVAEYGAGVRPRGETRRPTP